MSAEHGVKKLKRRVDHHNTRITRLENRIKNLESQIKKIRKRK